MSPQPSIPEGSVVITPAEVYAKVVELTTVVTKMVAADEAEKNDRSKIEARLTTVENRVTSLNNRLWFIAGIASAAGGGIGSGIAALLAQR
jgi:hypothetical protein